MSKTQQNDRASKQAGGPLPEGDYRLRVLHATDDVSKGGNQMIRLRLLVILDNGRNGPELLDYLVFSDTTLWKIHAFLKACEEYRGEDSHIDLDASEMIGWTCEATLRIDTFDGRQVNKVATYLYDEEF